MDFTYQSLNVLILLFPGFLSSTVFRFLSYRKQIDVSFAIIEALSFSLFNYLIIASIFRASPLLMKAKTNGNETVYSITYDTGLVLTILILSLAIPILLAFLINKDKILSFLRKLGFTTRTSRANTWLDVFAEIKGYVVINFKDGTRLYGWPMFYSNTAEEGKVYLSSPYRIANKSGVDTYESMDIQGIFIVNSDIEFIQFLKREEK